MIESAKFEILLTRTLYELQPYGLTCMVISICGLIGNILVGLKNMGATFLG